MRALAACTCRGADATVSGWVAALDVVALALATLALLAMVVMLVWLWTHD